MNVANWLHLDKKRERPRDGPISHELRKHLRILRTRDSRFRPLIT